MIACDDVIRMAREAGAEMSMLLCDPPKPGYVGFRRVEHLERFVSIVAAHIIARQPPPPMVVNLGDRAARIAAQTENEALKARLAASGVAECRAVREAVLAEREACAVLMAAMRDKSRNHLFRSALTIAEGEIRARGAA